MTEKRKQLLRWVGYPVLALVVFVFALHFTFPYDRVRDLVIEQLSGQYEVGIAEVGPGIFPGRFTIKGLTLTTRPASDSEKPKTLVIDRIDVSVGILALIGKAVSVDFDATLGEGRVVGNVESSARGLSIDAETHDVSLESVPGISVLTFGAPIKGPIVAKVKLLVPQMKWAQANGNIDIGCADCTIGDGVTKARLPPPPGQTVPSEGLTLPKIKLGELTAKVQITNGIACIVRIDAHSSEGELTLEGGVKLTDPPKDSQAQLYARIKLTDEFRNESARNDAIVASLGPRGDDGFTAYQARTSISALRWLTARTPPPPMRECAGVAQPAAAPRPAAARPTAPSVPVPVAQPAPASANKPAAPTVTGPVPPPPAEGTPPAAPAPAAPAPAAADQAPATAPVAPPAPGTTPEPGAVVAPVPAPEGAVPPPAAPPPEANPPPPAVEQPQPGPQVPQ